MNRKFKSAVDWWFYAVILVVPIAVTPVVFKEPASLLVVAIVLAISLVLPIWLLLATYYVVSDERLVIRSGPFRWIINRKDITKIERTNSPLSSPALSLNRLRIEYGNGRAVLVSPIELDEFIDLIEQGG